jgi:hypothetical protein
MFISDTNLHTIQARGFDVVTDTVFDTLTLSTGYIKFEGASAKMANTGGTNAISFPAGFHFDGSISAVKLVSGAIILIQ